jgi:hypothetical protein
MQLHRLIPTTLLTLAAGLIPLPAQQYDDQLNVGVRTQLDRQKRIWDGVHSHKLQNPPEHGKVFAILMIQPTKSKHALTKPVNAAAIRDELVKQLEAHDYHHVSPGQKPEILVSVVYGRSWLPNPYYTDNIDVDNMGPEDAPAGKDYSVDSTGGMPSAPDGIVINNPNLAARLSIPSVSHKATMAGLEKLFIMVRAFKYPPPADPKQKPEVLWVATMYVDDPDHRDLNTIAKQMLEAGAPFFDQEIKDDEAFVTKALPEGHVKVGAPQVVEPAKPVGR